VTLLPLDPDQLLSTTRAVRKRLDLTRPVHDDLVRECVAAALQAPSGSNNITMRFVVVRDAELRRELGQVYRECWAMYEQMDGVYVGSITKDTADEQAQQDRVETSARYLAEHLAEVPVHVIGCLDAGLRTDGLPGSASAALLANVLPAMWSFMLAARARGLGTAWTTVHLFQEEAVADILGIPYATVQQVCLSPLAHTIGTDFKPAGRPAPDSVIRWDSW
jgi:nitroreductase